MKHFIFKYAFYCAIGWTAVIFVLCCTPGKYVPSAHWLDLLSFDKLVHASIFFLLACFWFMVLVKTGKVSRASICLVLLACVCYGGILEIMQATVFSQRSGDWNDFIANSFGCTLALLLFINKKHFNKPQEL
jgi:VanZ family protein